MASRFSFVNGERNLRRRTGTHPRGTQHGELSVFQVRRVGEPPRSAADGAEPSRHEVRAGSVVSRPAGTRIAHAFRAGSEGMTLLSYGTRDPNDIVYYPRSRKISWRGVGVIARVEHVDYWADED